MDNKILLSTDTLHGYGLDRIFSLAVENEFNGIDLAIWKNYDAWNPQYVRKLIKKYDLPVETIQTSDKLNVKELNQAILLCEEIECKAIAINPPDYFNIKSYGFIKNNIKQYQEQYPDIKFSIISPNTDTRKYLPIPRYHFANLGNIIKKQKCGLGLDICMTQEGIIENFFMTQMKNLIKDIPHCYVSDRLRNKNYLIPGEGNHNIKGILRSLHKNQYKGNFSIKLDLESSVLIDEDKVNSAFQKSIEYIKKYYNS